MKFIENIKKKNRFKRYLTICDILNIKSTDKILDVGCGKNDRSFRCFNSENQIVGLDIIDPKLVEKKDNFKYIKGDSKKLPFKNNEFDIAVSIGMLEHIHPYDSFVNSITEIDRVSKKFVIIVPDRYGFIEPHFQMPFWYFYPEFLKVFLIKHFNLGSQHKNKTGAYQKLNHPKAIFYKELIPGCDVKSLYFGPFRLYYLIYKK